MEVARTSQGLCISQRKYIIDLSTEADMMGCKSAMTSLEHGQAAKKGMVHKCYSGTEVDKLPTISR